MTKADESQQADTSAASNQILTPTAEDAGQRLDVFLVTCVPALSRTRIQELILDGRVREDGRPAKAAQRCVSNEVVISGFSESRRIRLAGDVRSQVHTA